MKVVAYDFETYLMSAEHVTPKPVCISWATKDSKGVLGTCDTAYKAVLNHIFNPADDQISVAHNATFDLAVCAKHHPEYLPIIFNKLEENRFTDTILRAKMLRLAQDGIISKGWLADDTKVNRSRDYSLDMMVRRYFNESLADDKKKDPVTGEEPWRLRYKELEGVKAIDYPEKAYDYALQDSVWCLKIYEEQELERNFIINEKGFDPFKLEGFFTKKAFAFHMGFTDTGIHLNPDAVEDIKDMLDRELSREKMQILFDKGIINDEVPPMPYANGSRLHVDDCLKEKSKPSFLCDCPQTVGKTGKIRTKHVDGCDKKKSKPEWLCDCPVAMKPAEPEKANTKILQKTVCMSVIKGETVPVWTPKAQEEEGFTAVADNWLELRKEGLDQDMWASMCKFYIDNSHKLAVNKQYFADNGITVRQDEEGNNICDFPNKDIATYVLRSYVSKMKTTEIPRLQNPDGTTAEKVHASYDLFKATGRTSSFASKLYPSINAQNVHAKVRNCLTARKGYTALSVDYSGLEFITGAQTCINLIGDSNYARIINKGWDSHSYLAAQKVYTYDLQDVLSSGMTFKQQIDSAGLANNKDAMYLAFKQLEFTDKNFYKANRKAAKPDGLGFFGGLGAKTMVGFTKLTTGLEITEEQATIAKEVWKSTFPYAAEYLEYVKKQCVDPYNTVGRNKRFTYTTPMGLVRCGATFNACANGQALQSPSAEGATEGAYQIIREALDPTMKSVLGQGNYIPTSFCHDENIGDVKLDLDILDPCANRVMDLMSSCLRKLTPDVQVASDPAASIHWDKRAEAVYDTNGRLMIWLPNVKYDVVDGKYIDPHWEAHLSYLQEGIDPARLKDGNIL